MKPESNQSGYINLRGFALAVSEPRRSSEEKPMKDYLSRALRDWQEFDVTQHHLAIALGLVCDQTGGELFQLPKHVLWSANRVSDFLTEVKKGLVQLDALEEDQEESKFRWNPSYTMEAMVQRETGAS